MTADVQYRNLPKNSFFIIAHRLPPVTDLIYGVSDSISPSCGVSDRNSSSACR